VFLFSLNVVRWSPFSSRLLNVFGCLLHKVFRWSGFSLRMLRVLGFPQCCKVLSDYFKHIRCSWFSLSLLGGLVCFSKLLGDLGFLQGC